MSGNRHRGVVLLSTIIILVTIALIGGSLAVFFSSVTLSATIVAAQTKALYLAEAGIARAIHLLRTQADATIVPEEGIGPTALGEGTYRFTIDFSQSLITSTGEVEGFERTIQFQYRSL